MKKIIFLLVIITFFGVSCSKIPTEQVIVIPPENKISDQEKNEPVIENLLDPKNEEKPDKPNTVINTAGLSNEKQGWGLSVTNDETSPGIPDSWKNLLKKYNGYYLGSADLKKVYLTFDCGYEAGYTNQIIDTLLKNNVPAIFFVTGQYLDSKPDIVKRMADNGFIIGNHTINHPSLPSISADEMKEEILGLNRKIKSLTGKEFYYFRPPSGEFSEFALATVSNLGFKSIFWSLAFQDWIPLPGGAEESYQTVLNRIHPGAIILLHSVSKDNRDALQRIIDGIRLKGYEFILVDF